MLSARSFSMQLHELQQALLQDIYHNQQTTAPLLSTPANRLQVYYHNTLFNLIDTLKASYPVVQQLVGDDFFKTIVRHYIKQHPQTAGNRSLFGACFPDFLAAFPAAATLPYLADVALLEWHYAAAHHLPDASPATFADITPDAPLKLHPSAALLTLNHDALAIWQAHQQQSIPVLVLQQKTQHLLVWRNQEDAPCVLEISDTMSIFLTALQQELPFGQAITTEMQAEQHTFASLMQAGVFTTGTT
jgi:hypothetical protein